MEPRGVVLLLRMLRGGEQVRMHMLRERMRMLWCRRSIRKPRFASRVASSSHARGRADRPCFGSGGREPLAVVVTVQGRFPIERRSDVRLKPRGHDCSHGCWWRSGRGAPLQLSLPARRGQHGGVAWRGPHGEGGRRPRHSTSARPPSHAVGRLEYRGGGREGSGRVAPTRGSVLLQRER